MSHHPVTQIVIIGAGYTGIWTYRVLRERLKRQLNKGEVKITVICPKNYHSLHGFTAEALCGVVALSNRQNPLRLVLRDAQLVRAYAEQIDTANQKVSVRMVSNDQHADIPYDHLVLANGSYDKLDTVAGMRQFGWSLKEAGGVLASRNHLLKMLDYADASDDSAQITESLGFVIGGGGFAGVEIAANLAEMLLAARALFPVLAHHPPRIVLVHSGSALIPEIRPRFNRLVEYATQELTKWGVEIKLNARLVEVKDNGAMLSDGTYIPARTVISTIGQHASILPGTEHLPHTTNDLLITDAFLHVHGELTLWAGGDSAQVIHRNGDPCPANALWAVMHGIRLGDNLARTIQGRPLRKFDYHGMGHAASLGIGKGATELNGIQFTGWIAWFLRLFFCLYFMPSRHQTVRALFDWVMLPLLGRYQTSMETSVRQSQALRSQS